MDIRPALHSDLPQIQYLVDLLDATRQKNFSTTNKLFHQRTEKYPPLATTDFEKDIFLVAEDQGHIIAFVRGSISARVPYQLSKLGYIDDLFVVEEQRGKGMAQQLLKGLMKKFADLGCDHIITHTDQENAVAQQLYESMDMQKVTVEYWKKL